MQNLARTPIPILMHRPGHSLANADGLSRLPVPTIPKDPPKPVETMLLTEQLSSYSGMDREQSLTGESMEVGVAG